MLPLLDLLQAEMIGIEHLQRLLEILRHGRMVAVRAAGRFG